MSKSSDHPPITPEMKVAALLKAYPKTEDLLYEIAPAFSKLRNPILRRTVAKATSLRQAAKVAGIDLGYMINRLRSAVGQTSDIVINEGNDDPGEKPGWAISPSPVRTFDACALIEAGEQPMTRVMSDLKKLDAGDVYELITPFEPVPLRDMAGSKGFDSWSERIGDDRVRTLFRSS